MRCLFILVLVTVLFTSGCVTQEVEQTNGWITEDESSALALEFVKNSPTFQFDGIELRHSKTETMKCPSCWGFYFTFTSRNSGYGDRTGMILATVMTSHEAYVVVNNGFITSAILDDKWDILKQKGIATQIANPASTYCVENNGETIMMETTLGTAGYCGLEDGRVCEEWEFFRSKGENCTAPEIE